MKTALFVVGAVMGLVGMRLDNVWVIAAAIAVLFVAVGFRFLTGRIEEEE